jgi:hypothetical protein
LSFELTRFGGPCFSFLTVGFEFVVEISFPLDMAGFGGCCLSTTPLQFGAKGGVGSTKSSDCVIEVLPFSFECCIRDLFTMKTTDVSKMLFFQVELEIELVA